jgi:extracellular factor (EF) 3-hydroxypalmitic acid methyl ester biosynthesis protein
LRNTTAEIKALQTNNQNEPGAALDFLRGLIANGGPESKDYSELSSTIGALEYFQVPFESIRGCLAPILQGHSCLYGLAYSKPRGYAGDFEMIDRIYTGYVNPDPFFGRWDAH